MRITIDTEGAEYTPLELIGLSQSFQECWMKMGRGFSEIFSINFDITKYQEKIKLKQRLEYLCKKQKPEIPKCLRKN